MTPHFSFGDKDLLNITLLPYHLSKNAKALLWKNLTMTFFVLCGKKETKEYSQRRHKLIQNSSIMLFSIIYLGVNYLALLLPIVPPPSL